MSNYTGELFALVTAFLWTVSSVCWTVAGERVGSLAVNVIRLAIATPLLIITGLVFYGEAFPASIDHASLLWLALSGVFGFFLSDLLVFRSILIIGPRLAMLILSLAAPLTALFGWMFLGEHLSHTNWTGIGLVLAGIVWVITESPESLAQQGHRYVFSIGGGALALMGTVAMAVAMVLAKKGMTTGISALAATEIRIIPAFVCFVILILVLRRYPSVLQAFKDMHALRVISIGSFVGPFLGVISLMVSLQHVEAGIVQTFISLSPIMIIPFMRIIFNEPVRLRALAGAVIACGGIALLFVKN